MSSRLIPQTRMWRLAVACAIACLLPALISVASDSNSDESPLVPYLAVDINPSGSSWPVYMTPFDDVFLFSASHVITGRELWRSDGTASGTFLVKDINTAGGSSPRHFTRLGDFALFDASDVDHGWELWRTDGTAEGTRLVRDIYTGTADGEPGDLVVLSGTLLFEAGDGIHGRELWRSDGTLTGTVIVTDVNPSGDGLSYGSLVDDLAASDGLLFFAANDGVHGFELWASDGTPEGTYLVKDIYTGTSDSNPSWMAVVSDTLFFRASDGIHGGELWKSDGTPGGTVMVRDIYTGTFASSYAQMMTAVSDTLFFEASSRGYGSELWKSDGTPGGTVMVRDINGDTSASPRNLIAVGDTLFFTAETLDKGRELWMSDGTEGGTVLVKDINPAVDEGGEIDYLAAVEGFLFFRADDGTHGDELWMSDGTVTGTVMIEDINPGAADGDVGDEDMMALNGTLFFYADDGIHGGELWALPLKDLVLRKEVAAPYPIVPGSTLTYTLSYSNAGLVAATGAVISDAVPLELGSISVDSSRLVTAAGGSTAWLLGALEPGEQGVITLTGIVSPSLAGGYMLTNRAVITNPPGDIAPADNVAQVSAWVCGAVSIAGLEHIPEGDLFTGNTVRFTADVDGDTPITYTWRVNGSVVAGAGGEFDHVFAVSGTHSVSVTVANPCGDAVEATSVTVVDPNPVHPDLSLSYKSVSRSTVKAGDTVEYTLILRNVSEMTATATVTDPIPANTTYVSGTAQASDGTSVTVTGDLLTWSGSVISGTPVLIGFEAEVGVMPAGTVITNVATVEDGFGNVLAFQADCQYRPGYWLKINDGDWITEIPTVTLTYSWRQEDGITHVRFSNHSGFWPHMGTTAWMPVDDGNPVYADWLLPVHGGMWAWPYRAWAQFRDSTGRVYYPIYDRIIYDPYPPTTPWFWLIFFGPPGVHERPVIMATTPVTLRVTAEDSNSGVDRIQVSDDPDFGAYTEFPFIGPTADIPWTVQATGAVYVRALDRAGNISDVSYGKGPADHEVFLPLMLRGW